jgi:outer membrane protein assembly factor BamB
MGTACLNAKDGKIIWSNQAFGYKPVHGNGSSPVLYNDLLIFSADGAENPGVIALDKNTGKQVWRHERVSEAKRKFSFCTPLLIEVAGKTQLITPGSGVVSALDPATGSEIWRVTYDQGYSVVPRPVFGQGLLFISTGYDKPSLLAIRPDGQGDVTATHIAWRADKFAPHNPSPVVVGDDLYMVADNGVLSCLNAKSGEAYFQERCTGPISASLLFADGHLYLQDEAGLGVVVKPGHSLDIVQRNPLGERSLASPAICDADLLVRTQSHLYRIRK